MASRIKVLSGRVQQPTADTFTYLEIPTKLPEGQGMLLKSIEFALWPEYVSQWAQTQFVRALFSVQRQIRDAIPARPAYLSEPEALAVFQKCHMGTAAATFYSYDSQVNYRWEAPTGISGTMVSSDKIFACLDTFVTGQSNILDFRILYTHTPLSEMEKIQMIYGA